MLIHLIFTSGGNSWPREVQILMVGLPTGCIVLAALSRYFFRQALKPNLK
ncbi:MAG: hypothetical protein IPG22_03395 [Acidobacteria bacterium]|nr:hypothetical protein [Acidobacteriota bacterium]